MFLLASAALPDEVPDDGIDLAAYYGDNRRCFWLLFAVFTLLAFVLDLLVYTDAPGIPTGPLRALPTLVIVGLLGSLAVVRRRAYHAVMVLLLLAGLGWQWSQLRLG